MKTVTQTLNLTLETMASQATASSRPAPSARESQECRRKSREWQAKWLGLRIENKDVQRAANEAESFAGRFYRRQTERSMFTLFGQPGCGKTHIARKLHAFARAIAVTAYFAGGWGGHRIPSSQFISWPQACDGFKNGQFAALEDMLHGDFLAIDDIGAEHDPSKMCTEKLCQILSAREWKFTVVTTNFLPDQWIEKFDARIADRLLRNSVVVDMSQVPSFSTL